MKQLVLDRDPLEAQDLVLTGDPYHYLVRVRRVQPGHRFQAQSPGGFWTLEVLSLESDRLVCRASREASPEVQGPRLTLFPSLLKGKKLEDVVRWACEAGVAAIQLVKADHCVAVLDEKADKRVQRLTDIAREAVQQSGAPLPQILPLIESRKIPEAWGRRGPLVFFHEKPLDKGTLHGYLSQGPQEVGLIIGPEGGFSKAEVEGFLGSGALGAWLGPSVYRAETAALAALASVKILLQEWEHWSIRT